MKIPRFSISGLMAVVAIVAVDTAIFRSLERPRFFNREMAELIVCGMLPMANVLAFGLVPFLTRPGPIGGRPFLVRFEVFGAMTLLLFFAACAMATHEIHEGVGNAIHFLGILSGPLALVAIVALMFVPQLAIAWFGAWLIGRNKAKELTSLTKPHPESSIDFL